MGAMIYSWICPMRVDDAKKKILVAGCGGNWGEVLPHVCPTCGGPIKLIQTIQAVKL